jgi:CTP synthase
VHLSYVPWIAAAGELKTKPTQHTAKQLREIGIQADALICPRRPPHPRGRTLQDLAVLQRARVGRDLDVGRRHHLQGAAHAARAGSGWLICDKLRLNTPPAKLKRWDDLVYETEHPQSEVNIAMVGKYVDLSDSYKSLNEASSTPA